MTAPSKVYVLHHWDDFSVGTERQRSFTIHRSELSTFSSVSEDHHPLHRDPELAKARGFPDVVVHGMLVASKVSAFISEDFVGTHGLLVSMTCDFRAPVYSDEPLLWTGTLANAVARSGVMEISWTVANGKGLIVQRGSACATLPRSE